MVPAWVSQKSLSWLLLPLFCAYLVYPIFTDIDYFVWTEGLYFNRLRQHMMDSFLAGQLPVWNPLVGPGGSAAMFSGINGWEFKTLIYYFLGQTKYLMLVEFLIILAAFVGFSFIFFKKANLPFALATFLALYNLDLMALYAHHMPQSSTWISYFLLIGLIIKIESRPWANTPPNKKALFGILFFLVYWFSYQGTQVVIWVLQFNPMVIFTIFFFRLKSGGRMIELSKDRFYLSAVIAAALALSWQFYWVLGNIFESSRANADASKGFFATFIEFFRSFQTSTYVAFLLLYYGLYLVWRTWGSRNTWGLRFLGVAFLVAVVFHLTRVPMQWFIDDTILFKILPLWLAYSVLATWFSVFLALLTSRDGRVLLRWEYPSLILGLYFFLFESAYVNSYGPRPIEGVPPIAIALIAVVPVFGLFSKERTKLQYAVACLFVVFLLRSHFTVFLLRFFGLVWYVRRDTVFWGMGIVIPFYLGLTVLFNSLVWAESKKYRTVIYAFATVVAVNLVQYFIVYSQQKEIQFNFKYAKYAAVTTFVFFLVYLWKRPGKAKVWGSWGFAWGGLVCFSILFHQSTFRRDMWRPDLGNETIDDYIGRVAKRYGLRDSQERVLMATRRGIVSGFHTGLGTWQVNMYDSLIPAATKEKMSTYFETPSFHIPENCKLPVLWFTSNLTRLFDCPFNLRNTYYTSHIGNRPIDMENPKIFVEQGIRYVFYFKLIKGGHVERLDTEDLRDETKMATGIRPEELFLYRSTLKNSFSFLKFYPSSDCGHLGSSEDLKAETDYFQKPYLKRRASIGFTAPADGCLRLGVNSSNLWRVSLNGKRVPTQQIEGIYMGLPVQKGEGRIELTYLPYLEWFFGLSVLGFFWGIFWGFFGGILVPFVKRDQSE